MSCEAKRFAQFLVAVIKCNVVSDSEVLQVILFEPLVWCRRLLRLAHLGKSFSILAFTFIIGSLLLSEVVFYDVKVKTKRLDSKFWSPVVLWVHFFFYFFFSFHCCKGLGALPSIVFFVYYWRDSLLCL